MNLRGLEMLLALTGCMLFFGLFTGNLQLLDVLWAFAGILSILTITAGLMRTFFPYLKETKRWERFTETMGRSLTLHSRGGVQRPSLSGRVSECQVTISPVDREHLIVVSVPTAPPQLASHEISLAARKEEHGDQPSLLIGDPEFDRRVVLRGSLPEVVAVLDRETRAMILEQMGELSIQVRWRQVMRYGRHLELDPAGTWRCVQRMAKLAARLFKLVPYETREKLADNAQHDPLAKVRAMNLRLLFEYYPADERSLGIARRALDGGQIDCVLAAAVGLAEAGTAEDQNIAFRCLVGLATTELLPDEARSEAIDELSILFPEGARLILMEIAREHGPLPSSLLASMLAIGLVPDLDYLTGRATFADDATQSRILRRLPRESRFEPMACVLLDSLSEEVQLEAIDFLLECGTIRAVEELLPLTRGLTRSKALRTLAQSAVDAIQSRAGGHGGELSLTQRTRGELSLGTEGGSLSLDE